MQPLKIFLPSITSLNNLEYDLHCLSNEEVRKLALSKFSEIDTLVIEINSILNRTNNRKFLFLSEKMAIHDLVQEINELFMLCKLICKQ